ncbi:MAG TPA: DcaP family trimeric outer membrane transporter [Sphingomicrobium sp.]|nr:DcaP family trimeric outer membrane transporter [Sphingomicrobium sp.]
MRTSIFLLASGALVATPAIAAEPTGATVATAAGAAQDQAARPLTPEERAQALQELQDLRARMNRLESVLGVPSTAPPTPVPPAPGSSLARDHNLELYGFVQLDAIQDFNRVNPAWDATLRPSRIPTVEGQFGSDGQSVFSVRQTRLGAKATGTLAGKPYEAKFEFDLYGVGVDEGQTTFRLRHAYASWGPFLAGQTNSLFMDGDLFPNTIDYWGPAGMVFLRNPQLRWTFWNRNGFKAAVALEHPGNDIDKGNLRLIDEDVASNIQNDEKLPDATAQLRYEGKWGHVQLSGILRRVGYDTLGTENNRPKGHKTGWGVNLGSSFNVSLATARIGAVYGRGIASYMNDGGMDLAPNIAVQQVPGSIVIIPSAEAVKLFGWTSYIDFNWSKQWTSSVGYSFDKVDNTNFQADSAFHKGQYASVNLLWHPASGVFTGGELLWGKRTDNDGNSGKDLRFQYSFHWDFSSKNLWSLFD